MNSAGGGSLRLREENDSRPELQQESAGQSRVRRNRSSKRALRALSKLAMPPGFLDHFR
jgi:hypothetical protein